MRITYSKFIFLGAIVGILIGVAYSMLIQPVFIAESSIKIGSIRLPSYQISEECDESKPELIESQHSLRKILYWRYRIREARLNRLQLPFLIAARAGDSPDIVMLSARGRTPEEAVDFLKSVDDWVMNRHRKKYEITNKELRNHIQVIQNIFVESKLLHAVHIDQGTALATNSMNTAILSEEGTNPLALMLQMLAQIDLGRLGLNSYPTEILSEPIWTGKQSEPKTILYILTGLIAGIVTAATTIGIYRELKIRRVKI